MFRSLNKPELWTVTLSAAGILMLTMGIRQSFGLFISPINTSTGAGIGALSLALAIGQFVWGAIQPFAGAAADHYGPQRVLLAAIAVMALGCALTPWMSSSVSLIFTFGVLTSLGSGAGSFSVLMGAAAARLPPNARGTASGIINAGGSFGQFVFAPLTQKLIQALGWMGALWSLAVLTFAALPLVRTLTRQAPIHLPPPAAGEIGLWQSVRQAFSDNSYLLLHAGFFTCGFHIAFLVTHLPGEVALCGLPTDVASWSLAIIGLANIAGSLYAGACIARYRSKYVLSWMYGSRTLLIALYLISPKTALTFYLFAAGLGFTWLATVPPTANIVGKLFGVRYLGTLFGLTLLSHQIGAFFGAWLGGIAITLQGDYQWMWYADMVLAGLAALVNLPIREAPVVTNRAAA